MKKLLAKFEAFKSISARYQNSNCENILLRKTGPQKALL